MCAIFPVAPIAMATKAVLAYRFGSCARVSEFMRIVIFGAMMKFEGCVCRLWNIPEQRSRR